MSCGEEERKVKGVLNAASFLLCWIFSSLLIAAFLAALCGGVVAYFVLVLGFPWPPPNLGNLCLVGVISAVLGFVVTIAAWSGARRE